MEPHAAQPSLPYPGSLFQKDFRIYSACIHVWLERCAIILPENWRRLIKQVPEGNSIKRLVAKMSPFSRHGY
jgi:hypothetical protein